MRGKLVRLSLSAGAGNPYGLQKRRARRLDAARWGHCRYKVYRACRRLTPSRRLPQGVGCYEVVNMAFDGNLTDLTACAVVDLLDWGDITSLDCLDALEAF